MSTVNIWSGSGKVMAISLELLLETFGSQSIQCIARSVLHFQKGGYTKMALNQYRAIQGVLKTGEYQKETSSLFYSEINYTLISNLLVRQSLIVQSAIDS